MCLESVQSCVVFMFSLTIIRVYRVPYAHVVHVHRDKNEQTPYANVILCGIIQGSNPLQDTSLSSLRLLKSPILVKTFPRQLAAFLLFCFKIECIIQVQDISLDRRLSHSQHTHTHTVEGQ